MKIKRVTIENFRNIKSLAFDVTNATIISGENELGKSNALNAIVWFFTDTIYTDNSGVGENDINSIVPKDQVKGEHTSVSVEFVDGPTFTKVYKTGYDRLTGKPNKHTTEGLINSVGAKNMNEWTSKLMETVGFSPVFSSVKELNLNIDPLYALQKLDSKALRTLLVSFGCTATNEEMYALGFEDLRQYEKKYLGDFVNMRLDLKKQLKVINESVNKYQILVNQFNTVVPFDETKLADVNARINDLQDQKSKLVNGGNDAAVKEFEYKIKEVRLQLDTERNNKLNEINLKVKELEGKKALELDNINSEKENQAREIKSEINRLETVIASIETSIKAYNKSLETLRSNLMTTQTAAKNIVSKKSDYQSKLVAASQRTFTGFVICPCCGNSFAPDEDAERQFELHKNQDIKFYTDNIAQFNIDIDNYQKECKEIVKNANNTKDEIAKLNESLAQNKEWLESNKATLNDIMNAPVDMSKINDLDNEIGSLKASALSVPTTDSNPSLIALYGKLENLRTSGRAALDEQINDLVSKIDMVESEREDLYIERSNWNQKLDHQKNLEKSIAELNDVEALLQRVNDYIHAMIQLINDKAKAKTGMDFVMLEENLGNDGVKEVCYAMVDGVPFSMINTAKKYEYGIKFIEKVKDIAVNDFGKERNDLPILADKFEGIDHAEKIKTFTKEQLICTRVGLEKEITIL